MDLTLPVAEFPLAGTLEVPGDKSLSHRAALLGALAEGVSRVENCPASGVVLAMLGVLRMLGVECSLENGTLIVAGGGCRPFPNGNAVVFCGNSATTMRLVAGAVAATRSCATLDGSDGLRRRPMDRIAEPLRRMGADIATTEGHAPVVLRPAALRGGSFQLDVASAQVKSCIEIAALGADGPVEVSEPAPSRDHTIRMLRAMGARTETAGLSERIWPLAESGPLRPLCGRLPGDISSAAFLFAAAAIVPGSRIEVRRLGVNPGRTGFLDVLCRMGAEVDVSNLREEFGEPVADVSVAAGPLRGTEVFGDETVRMIDEFPALAAVAAFADGETVVRDAAELRYKESDRIASIVSLFSSVGAKVRELPDGFVVEGGRPAGGVVDAGGDHRLAMALAVCGLRSPVTVKGAEILDESFPGFAAALAGLMPRSESPVQK